jgi:DNA-binding XRE family transcriptional regulator
MEQYTKLKARLLKDKQIKKAYIELGPEFALVEKFIERRIENGLSQSQLAKKIGTKQSAISRFESGRSNPSIGFLRKLADAVDARITITVS